MAGCPFLSSQTAVIDQFSDIREQYPILSSTGCTKNFCQSGRMTHTDEERVGRNRPHSQVREEAIDFLQQMYREGMFSSAEALHERAQEVLAEIQRNSKEGSYQTAGAEGPEVEPLMSQGLVGGHWTQTYEELEFGIRTAWKHARKCIMRSEYKELR